MAVTKIYKVYGADGHRQRRSFDASVVKNWSSPNQGIRIFEVENSDKTGTNEYSIVRITRNTEDECGRELSGQITDGYFENVRVGEVVDITDETNEREVLI
jgi:hypothetical protein